MRILRIGLILLVVLGGLAVAADRVALYLAEGEVAAKAQTSLGLDKEPEVSVKGFPFLTQLLDERLEQVDMSLSGYHVVLDEERAVVDEMRLELRDVDLGEDYSKVVAQRVTGTGLMHYDEVTKVIGDERVTGIAYAGNGQLDVTLNLTWHGISMRHTVTSDILLEGNTVQVRANDLPDLPNVPGVDVEAYIDKALAIDREVTGLPSGLTLEGVRAVEDGVELSVSGTDVPLNG